jgi:hypothetical protein
VAVVAPAGGCKLRTSAGHLQQHAASAHAGSRQVQQKSCGMIGLVSSTVGSR